MTMAIARAWCSNSYDGDYMQVKFATTYVSKLIGLLVTPKEDGMILALCGCNDIHTFGMKYALDVVFLDETGCVLATYNNVLPNRRIHCRGAKLALERPHCNETWFCVDDKISLAKGAL